MIKGALSPLLTFEETNNEWGSSSPVSSKRYVRISTCGSGTSSEPPRMPSGSGVPGGWARAAPSQKQKWAAQPRATNALVLFEVNGWPRENVGMGALRQQPFAFTGVEDRSRRTADTGVEQQLAKQRVAARRDAELVRRCLDAHTERRARTHLPHCWTEQRLASPTGIEPVSGS